MRVVRLALCAAALATACVEPETSPASPVALRQPGESSAFFAAALAHFAGSVEGRLLVDPRPLKPGADLARLQGEDLAPNAAATVQLRTAVLVARGITATDAVADFRCTFSSGVGVPPECEATLPDSIRQRTRECRARAPYTTLIFGLPQPATDARYGAGTWRLEALMMTAGGFRIWDLHLQPGADGLWRVAGADARFTIWS